MSSTLRGIHGSTENLRIAYERPADAATATRTVRLPIESYLLTPPQTPIPTRRTRSETLTARENLPSYIPGVSSRHERSPEEKSNPATSHTPPLTALTDRPQDGSQSLAYTITPPPSLKKRQPQAPTPSKDEQIYLSAGSRRSAISATCKDARLRGDTCSDYGHRTVHGDISRSSKRPGIRRFPRLPVPWLLDGSRDCANEDIEMDDASPLTGSPMHTLSEDNTPISDEPAEAMNEFQAAPGITGFEHIRKGRQSTEVDLSFPKARSTQLVGGMTCEDITPMTRASPAIGAFPFPQATSPLKAFAGRRYPSALLHQISKSTATSHPSPIPRFASQTPDRFIPVQDLRSTSRERYMLAQPPERLPGHERKQRRQNVDMDPFSLRVRHGARQAQPTLQIPRPGRPMQTPVTPTRVHPSRRGRSPLRAVSQGAVWAAGGPGGVSDGVRSTSDGRGGRVASSTNAPLYSTAFFNHSKPSDEQEAYERRLALAFNVDPAIRVFAPTPSPSLPSSPTLSSASSTPSSPASPILDAPALRDDYYCSLLAYSITAKCLAVGLGSHVYLWSEARGVNTPESLTAPYAGHVTSLSFSSVDGGNAILAIGRADGRITLWSPFDRDPRFDSDQPAPVSCVSFSPRPRKRTSIRDSNFKASTEELLIRDEAGHVYFYSVEWPNQLERDLYDWHGSMTLIARMTIHTQQICGLAWSPDGDFFATGGNDNTLYLFETRKILSPTASESHATPVSVRASSTDPEAAYTAALPGQGPVLSITPGREKHRWRLNAAVKAIAFCPWQPSLLAAGGGSNDRAIHFYHTLSGATLATIDCSAQVTSLIWSRTRREIAATFGFAQPDHPYRVAVFSWPKCEQLVAIPWWGEERALWAVPYPGGPNAGGEAGAGAAGGEGSREGGAWYGRRTREEGCLVIATSDASIKFHEVWSESRRGGGLGAGTVGSLGGSDILEALHGVEKDGRDIIR